MGASDPVEIARTGKWLVVRFAETHNTLSWALVKGGRAQTRAVAWYQVRNEDLVSSVDPKYFLKERLESLRLQGAVGLVTSRDLNAYVDCEKTEGSLSVRVIATVGLSNAVRVGDPPSDSAGVGTINLLCRVSCSLSDEAMAETLALCAEARAAALLEVSIPSKRTGAPATGTGTDCIVVAAPLGKSESAYCGKHTRLGSLIGSAVLEAIERGAEAWKAENIARPQDVFSLREPRSGFLQ